MKAYKNIAIAMNWGYPSSRDTVIGFFPSLIAILGLTLA